MVKHSQTLLLYKSLFSTATFWLRLHAVVSLANQILRKNFKPPKINACISAHIEKINYNPAKTKNWAIQIKKYPIHLRRKEIFNPYELGRR